MYNDLVWNKSFFSFFPPIFLIKTITSASASGSDEQHNLPSLHCKCLWTEEGITCSFSPPVCFSFVEKNWGVVQATQETRRALVGVKIKILQQDQRVLKRFKDVMLIMTNKMSQNTTLRLKIF